MNQTTYATAEYWLESLVDANELRLPVSTVENTGVARVRVPVSREDVLLIRKIAGDKDLNVLKLFLGGLGILLWKYSAQHDLVISMPPMLLPDVDLAASGTLHCKLSLQEDEVVRTFFSQVHTSVNDAYSNGEYDEAEFLAAYAQAKDGNLSPIKGAGFNYHGLNAQGNWLNEHALVFDYVEGIEAYINVTSRNAAYPVKMLQNMAESLLMLVVEFPANKDKRIGECNIVPSAQLQPWTRQFEGNTRNYPADVTVVGLFIRSAAQFPTKAALVSGEETVTYHELDEWSKRIANFIAATVPYRADMLIGIMMERSPMLVAAILGILRAGAAYVPIDRDYPDDRIRDILHDSSCALVLTDADEAPVTVDGCSFVNVQSINSSDEYPPRLPAPENLAYIIYSSGTTGKPKGIMMEHRAIMNLLFWYNERYDINQEARIVQLTNIVIDIAFQEIFSALMNGITLYMPLKEETQDKHLFIEYLDKHRINFIQLIPDMLSEYLSDIPKLPYLEQVLCGGDRLGDTLKDLVVGKGYKLYNIYGQTETAIDTVGAVCRYGLPMQFNEYVPHYDVLIMDEQGNVCPEFIPGEVYTGGDGLARGYLNQPALTAQKFIPHPLREGRRIYRTGDVARRLPDGSIELMGRKDDQVKIRGFRVELSEIENALRDHPEIDAAVVLALQKGQDKQLVAYMVCNDALSAASIRNYLSHRVTAYMMPTHFVQLDKLPLTPSGKVDRRKLPAPEDQGMDTGVPYVPPANELEAGMVNIWQELLGKERIGIRDGFFELGGDSIKILRMMSELKKVLDIKISFADIYEFNTIGNIAAHVLNNKDHIEQKNKKIFEKEALVNEQLNSLKERVLASGNIADKDNIEDIYPMSDIEKGIVYESMLREGSGIYHDLAVHERVFADFDIERFTMSLRLLMEKHSILRTSFNISDYETEIQLVHKHVEVPIRYRDIKELQREEQENIIRAFIAAELQDPFKFSVAPLWRVCVFNCRNDQVVFVTETHHSIMDGWSDALFMTELNNLYLQLGKDPSYQPAPLKSSYKDFIVRHEIDKSDETIKNFWKQELAGYTRLDLFAEDEVQRFACSLDADFIRQLEKAATDLGVSVKIISLSAYLLLLKILNYGNEVVAGLVTNTRPDCEDSDKLIGCFLNTIPLRMFIEDNATGMDLVSQVNKKLIALKDHERMSMLEISLLHNKQLQHGNPFFDVIFNYVDFHAYNNIQQDGAGRGDQSSAAGNVAGNGVTNTYLDLDVNRTGGDYNISFRLGKKLKSGMPAEKLAELFRSILTGIIANPQGNIHDWSCITEQEEKLLRAFNDTTVNYGHNKTIPTLFEEQVLKTPGNYALVIGGETLSYRGMNELANRLADYMGTHCGIKPGDIVAIKLGKKGWEVVLMLAIMKCGAAYMPVDPDYPEERSAFMISDSRCKLVVDEKIMEAFRLVRSDCSNKNPELKHRPEDLAYIIYTSGSTGKPKGVMIEHRSLADYALTFKTSFNLREHDKVVHQASVSFDTHVEEIFPVLISGGTLLVVRNGGRDLHELQEVIDQQQATVLSATPHVLCELNALNCKLDSLRLMISGGEAFNSSCIASYIGKMDVYDSYGPSEATVCSTWNKIENAHTVAVIGKPISNRRIYILNSRKKLLPIGVPGEIFISGAGLARGYLNHPALTLENFISNPYEPGERMYAAGDLGRWLPDGKIEFIGRKDEQVKVSGYRIEPGEIESVLQSYAGVDSAVVLAKPNGNGDAQLVAYIVSNNALETPAIRAHLDKVLPVYMVPHRYVQLPEMPLTPNGKIDRKALLALDCEDMSIGVEYVAPRNETEEKLVQVWQQVLGKEKIGIRDHFFELGGHSLKITRLASQIHRVFEVKIPLKELFNRPVLKEQAAFIQRSRKTAYSTISPVAEQSCYPMSAAQRRLWILCQFEQGSIAYNMPAVYEFEGNLDKAGLEYAFNALIERHESLRTVFKEDEEGEIKQFINSPESSRFNITFTDIRHDRKQQETLSELVLAAIGRPFDLVNGPLLNAFLYQVEDNKWVFAYVMHHIIGDGWSMNVMMNDLMVFYDAHTRNESPGLAPLKIQYKDYTAWQLELMNAPDSNNHRGYWLNQFSGELPLLALPGDKTRPAVKTYNGGMVSKTIDAKLAAAIKAMVQEQEGTLFMGLLGAVNTLLYKYTNQEDIIVGSPIAGREHIDLEDQIGFYINTLALRTRFNREEGFLKMVERIKEVTLGAYEHQSYPLDELVNELDLQRDMSRSALFDVLVVLQNIDDTISMKSHDFGGLNVKAFDGLDTRSSAFDLVFTFAESKDTIDTTIEYNSNIYHRDTVARMAEHLVQLLQVIVADPSLPIEQLDYLGAAEKQQLLTTFSGPVQEYPQDKTLLYRFDEQVQKNPSYIALAFEDQELTYCELNERANQVANYLLENYAIKPNDFIGIQLDRSEWLVIAMLGVLKSGAAYVPIDPAYPQERIDYIIEDSSCKVVIDHTVLANFWTDQQIYSKENLPSVNKSDDLAYIIYTSGSTGKPKGVMIEHRNAIAFLNWSIAEFADSDFDVVFGVTSICFDLSVYEIFYTLSIGKKLRVLNNALSIPQYLPTERKILLNTVPGAVGALLAEQVDWSNVTVLNMAGEPVPSQFAQELDCERIEVRNLYGPSEDTTYSTNYRMRRGAPVLVGRPISNTEVYIVGNRQELVPVGVTGEICIGGHGLARGYLNQPSLTAEKFVPNPFRPGTRMYKTGDVGRWKPDGNIEFLGRKDDQVKVRGFRIELAEIETALRNMPEINAAVVVAKALKGSEKELIAYVVGAETLSIPAMRAHLGKLLPAYMVPGHFVQLEALPVTPNGKVDKKKLPNPGLHEADISASYVAPRNEQERKLVAVLEELLGQKNISLHDNFFELGGHSLKAMKLLGILNRQHGFRLKIQDIYNRPTIEELFFGKENGSGMIRLTRNQEKSAGNIYFIPPILGHAVLYKPLADKLGKRFNCYGFQYHGLEKEEVLYESIEQAAMQFSDEIIKHQSKGEVVLFGYSMGSVIAFEMTKILEQKNIDVRLVLVDRGIPGGFEKLLDRLAAGAETKRLLALYRQLVPGENVDEPALKRFLSNNIKILNRYRQSGKIKGAIYAFEADRNKQRMKQWSKYTAAGVVHSFIKGGHWDALQETNIQHVAQSIDAAF